MVKKQNGKPSNDINKKKPSNKRKASSVEGPIKYGAPLTEEQRNAKKLKLKKDLYKAVNIEEINQIKATEKLYHSNFFHLQIEELLKETKLKTKQKRFAENWLTNLNEFLLALESDSEKQWASDLKWLMEEEIVPPISSDIPFDDSKYYFQFLTPKSVFAIGSFRTATVIDVEPVLDICVEIPAEFFQKGNHLNGIYHRKRALYMSHLALKIKQWNEITECKFLFLKDDPMRPVLELKPNHKHGKHLKFHLHVVCCEESFKMERFTPEKSNVKQLLLSTSKKNTLLKNEEHTATPFYNSTVLRDLTTSFNEEFLCNTIGENENVRDAIVLLKIWLRQRGLDVGYGGFSGYILSMFVVYLLQKERINLSMNSYQIMRHVWINFENTLWNEADKSISLYESKFRTTQPEATEFHSNFDVAFIDSTGFYNICSAVSLDIYLRVRQESEKALKILNDEHVNSFRCLFATKLPLYLQFDHIFRLNESVKIKNILETYGKQADVFNFSGHWYPHILKMVLKILRQGLSKRIYAIIPFCEKNTNVAWNIHEQCQQDAQKLRFGLIMNPEYAFDILDKGPQSNLPEAEDFRKFWGAKSELRRFQDGSITEACVWGTLTSPLNEKRLICQQIIYHLLDRHFDISPNQISYTATESDYAYTLSTVFEEVAGGKNNSENLSIAAIKTFDELAKCLRSLNELPLVVTSVLGSSPILRYCELNPVLPNARIFKKDEKESFHAQSIIEGVIQFEASGKWPNELPAIKRLKAAFYLQIARGLRQNFNLKAKVNVDSVDVIKDGFMFRLKIAVPREMALYKKEVTTKGITKYRDTPESMLIERELILLPKLTVSLHTLYHQHTSFGPTVLIAKRWLNSQLIDSFLWPDECTEILIAHQFLYSKIDAPCQPQTGFIRFLQMLAYTNWKTEMVLFNFNDELSKENIEKLDTKFITARDSFPPLCIVTSDGDADKYVFWTKEAPLVEILARVTLLARHAMDLIQQNIIDKFLTEPLFNPSLDGYDLIIKLNKSHLRTSLLHNFRKNVDHAQCKPYIPLVDYNPVESYLKELRSAFDHVAVFFYNPCRGQNIAVLWKPFSTLKQDFRLPAVNGQQATKDDQLEFNYKQIKMDFLIIGQGLVESLVDNREQSEINVK